MINVKNGNAFIVNEFIIYYYFVIVFLLLLNRSTKVLTFFF